MNSSFALILVALMLNIAVIYSMPSWPVLSDEYPTDSNDFDTLAKRLTLPQWIHKRNPGLCDYRLQLRPLPLTSALCAYGHTNNDGSNPVQPFKYG